MAEDYPARHAQLVDGFKDLAAVNAPVMDGFSRMHRGATTDGALSALTKELMALAIAVAVRCDGCIAFHVHDAVRAGASEEQVAETLGVAILMGGGPAAVYAADAMRAHAQFVAAGDSQPGG